MRTFYKLALATAVAAALMVVPTAAHAGFQLKITSSLGGGTLTVNDNNLLLGSHDDTRELELGEIGLDTAIFGGYTISLSGGSSKPSLGSAGQPALALSYVVVRNSNGAAGTVTIEITDTGFTKAGNMFIVDTGGTNSKTTTTVKSGAGLNDVMYNQASSSAVAASSLSNFGIGSTFGIGSNGGNPYSLTIKAVIVDSGKKGNNGTGNIQLSGVPEPASLAMWGFGALGMMIVRKRRQAKLVA